ncbi:GNAT family N-acetyltransferase [Nocardioides litoris]|uniref:GNAT family N-acetyltransferase n=1 Tax=Nocardioides litoris TaxID=1926648 RepID=UPI0011233ECA|nr:GNAT family N-acetyltransferase [Nocardioides litoris]
MTTALHVAVGDGPRLLAGPAAIDGVVEAWRDLAARAPRPNPFNGPDLLRPALRHLPDGDRVRLLVVPDPHEAGALGLVLPVLPRVRHRRLPRRAAVGWQHTHHFLGTPLLAPGFGVSPWRAALAGLERDLDDTWLLLGDLDETVATDVERAAAADGRATARLAVGDRPVTERRPTDDYLQQRLSGSRRKELRRVRRRLDEALGGGLEVLDLVPERGVDEALATFLRLEAAGWKGTDGGAVARHPEEEAYFVEACRALAARGALQVLALQGRRPEPAAVALDVRDGDTLFTVKTAFDESLAAWSPGLLLWMEEVPRFHASGARLLDTCAVPGHPMASRLHGDARPLVTLAVALRRGAGDRAVRSAPALLRAQERARDVVRRRTETP